MIMRLRLGTLYARQMTADVTLLAGQREILGLRSMPSLGIFFGERKYIDFLLVDDIFG